MSPKQLQHVDEVLVGVSARLTALEKRERRRMRECVAHQAISKGQAVLKETELRPKYSKH